MKHILFSTSSLILGQAIGVATACAYSGNDCRVVLKTALLHWTAGSKMAVLVSTDSMVGVKTSFDIEPMDIAKLYPNGFEVALDCKYLNLALKMLSEKKKENFYVEFAYEDEGKTYQLIRGEKVVALLSTDHNDYPQIISTFEGNQAKNKAYEICLGVEELEKVMKAMKARGLNVMRFGFNANNLKPCTIRNEDGDNFILCTCRPFDDGSLEKKGE